MAVWGDTPKAIQSTCRLVRTLSLEHDASPTNVALPGCTNAMAFTGAKVPCAQRVVASSVVSGADHQCVESGWFNPIEKKCPQCLTQLSC